MKLDYDLICKATQGNHQALNDVLRYYDHYIDALCAYEIKDENGIVRREIDIDMKIKLQLKLADEIKKWKELI
jgi:hypothetical protein